MNNPLLVLLVFVLFALASTAFGRKLLRLMRVRADSRLEELVFALGLGFGALAYLVLAVGLAGWLYPWVLIILVGAVGAVSAPEIVGVLKDVVGGIRSKASTKLRLAASLTTLSAVSLGTFTLISALSPPSGLDWDGLAYHLAVPKMYLSRHAIFYVPFISHSNFPFLTEMLYTLGLSLGSASLAKLFHFGMYVATAAAVYSLGRRYLSPIVGGVGALLFMSVPVVLWEAGLAYADIATALYITLAVYAVLNWEQTKQPSWLVACGLMGSFALGAKVLAAVPIGALCLWILMVSGLSRRWGRGLGLSVVVGTLALVVGAPWYIKSYIYTGNPVYPFLYDVFGGRYWSREAAEMYRGAQLEFGMGRGIGEFLLLPWNLSMNGFRFFDSPGLFGLIGAAFIGLIPLQALSGGTSKVVGRLGLVALAFIVAWFVLMQQARYLIGVLPLLCIMAASGVETANARWRIGRHAVNGFIGLCVALSLMIGTLIALGQARVVWGLETRDEYLSRSLNVYDAESYANDFLPADAKIVLFDEVRGFYLDREYIWGNPGHHELIPWSSFTSGADMVEFFKSRRFTHVLINWRFAPEPDTADQLHGKLIPDAIARGLMREIYASRGVSLYEFEGI